MPDDNWSLIVIYNIDDGDYDQVVEEVVGRNRNGSGCFANGDRDMEWRFDNEFEARSAQIRLTNLKYNQGIPIAITLIESD